MKKLISTGIERTNDLDPIPEIPSTFLDLSDKTNCVAQELLRLLHAQAFIVDKSIWLKNGRDPRFLRAIAKELLGKDEDPSTFRIGSMTLEETLTRINDYFYCSSRTSGASEFRERLIQLQEGEFCVVCGTRPPEELQVDHIVPINSGGPHHLSNMQLLCKTCNQAKSSWKSYGLGALLQLSNDAAPSKNLKFKVLIDGALSEQGRRLGVCGCGTSARTEQLGVDRIRPSFAPTYTNLRVHCSKCR